MVVKNYKNDNVDIEDLLGIKYKLLGVIEDGTSGVYIIYHDYRDKSTYIEEVKTKSLILDTLNQLEIKYIEDDVLFTQLYNLAKKEGILD